MGNEMQGRVAIVTGGSSGVGLGITRQFLAAGASVVTCSRRAFDPAPAAKDLEDPSRTLHLQADVRNFDDIDRVIATTLDTFGHLDVLVNNAGGQPHADVSTVSPRFIKSIIEINLTGPFVFAQKANTVMQQQETGGSIINIGSMASIQWTRNLEPYGAAKAGLNQMTQLLARAWGPKVRVNCIPLGLILTESMVSQVGPETSDGWKPVIASIPMDRLGKPEEIGDLCIFLCSEKAGYVTGSIIYTHGGGAEVS